MSGPWALRFDGVAKRFPRGLGLAHVDLHVAPGEAWLLAGANGAGKSTLLHLAAGLLHPSRGRVEVFGQPPRQARDVLGFQPEHFRVMPQLTVWGTMRYFGQLAGLPPAARDAQAEARLTQFGLWPRRHDRVATLSKGSRQRLGVAQSLMARPALLLWDEPASGLDPAAREDLRGVALAERNAGRALVIATHVVADVAGLCDHVAILAGGRLAVAGAIATLLAAGGHASLQGLVVAHSRPPAGEPTAL